MMVPLGGKVFLASEQMSALRFEISSNYYANSKYPATINAVDPWGNPVNYKATSEGFIVYSSGPDSTPGTSDDIY